MKLQIYYINLRWVLEKRFNSVPSEYLWPVKMLFPFLDFTSSALTAWIIIQPFYSLFPSGCAFILAFLCSFGRPPAPWSTIFPFSSIIFRYSSFFFHTFSISHDNYSLHLIPYTFRFTILQFSLLSTLLYYLFQFFSIYLFLALFFLL